MRRYEKMMIKLLFILFNSLSVDMVLQVITLLQLILYISMLDLQAGQERPVVVAGDRNVQTVVEAACGDELTNVAELHILRLTEEAGRVHVHRQRVWD